MHSAQSCALFLGDLGACPKEILKIRLNLAAHFANEVATVMFISHDYVIVPTTLNIKQTKF